MALHRILAARPASPGELLIEFATGESRVFDTRPYQTSDFFRRLADPAYFAQVRVQEGTVTWPDGHDFDPGMVYARSVSPPDVAAPAA